MPFLGPVKMKREPKTMNEREFRWHEGKCGQHPDVCTCVTCCEARRRRAENLNRWTKNWWGRTNQTLESSGEGSPRGVTRRKRKQTSKRKKVFLALLLVACLVVAAAWNVYLHFTA